MISFRHNFISVALVHGIIRRPNISREFIFVMHAKIITTFIPFQMKYAFRSVWAPPINVIIYSSQKLELPKSCLIYFSAPFFVIPNASLVVLSFRIFLFKLTLLYSEEACGTGVSINIQDPLLQFLITILIGTEFSICLDWEVPRDGDALTICYILWMVPALTTLGFNFVAFTKSPVDFLSHFIIYY